MDSIESDDEVNQPDLTGIIDDPNKAEELISDH